MKIQIRTKIFDTSHEQPSTFMYRAPWVITRKKKVAGTSCRRNQNIFLAQYILPKTVTFTRLLRNRRQSLRNHRSSNII